MVKKITLNFHIRCEILWIHSEEFLGKQKSYLFVLSFKTVASETFLLCMQIIHQRASI